MPAPCLVLAALLLTQSPGGTCTPRPLDDTALEQVTAGGARDVPDGVLLSSSFHQGQTSTTTTEQRQASYDGRVDPAVLRLAETRSGVVDGDTGTSSTTILYGSGFAAAGSLEARFETGSVAVSQDIRSVFTTSASVCFLVVFCVSEEGTYSGRSTASASVTMPAIAMTLTDGAACAAILATCSGSGTSTRRGSYATTGTAPVQVTGAGEYIAVGGATLTVDATAPLHLFGGAQAASRALNLAHAARSVVGAGLNVATPTAAPRLQQHNSVTQRP